VFFSQIEEMQIDTTTASTAVVVIRESRKEKQKYSKKKGVELVMKFRNHKDPLYYDPNSNDKIFVAKQMVNTATHTNLIQ
jgi:hypothetical protein